MLETQTHQKVNKAKLQEVKAHLIILKVQPKVRLLNNKKGELHKQNIKTNRQEHCQTETITVVFQLIDN